MPDTVTIYYERKLSDGDYGSEGLSMGVTVELGGDGLDNGTTAALYARLKAQRPGTTLGSLGAAARARGHGSQLSKLGAMPARHAPLDDDDDEPPF